MKNKKERPKRRSFAERLTEKLELLQIGEVRAELMGDDSCYWVDLKIGKRILEFTFDSNGEKLEDVTMYKEIWESVDQKKIFGRK